MDHKNSKYIFLILTLLLVLLLIVLIGCLYNTGHSKLIYKADLAFKEAIEEELNIRFAKLNIPFSFIPKLDNREYKNIEWTYEKGDTLIKVDQQKEIRKVTSIFEQRVKQTIAFTEIPINIHVLDSLWQTELINRHINAITHILINDTISLGKKQRAYKKISLSYFAGINNEILIKASLTPNMLSVLSNGKTVILFLSVFHFLIIIFYLFYYFINSRYNKNEITQVLKNDYIVSNKKASHTTVDFVDGIYRLSNLYFDPINKRIIYENEIIKVRPQIASLLTLFLQSSDLYLKTDLIINHLWPVKSYYGIENRLQRSISDLRKFLQYYLPNIRIEFEYDGYRLFIDSNV